MQDERKQEEITRKGNPSNPTGQEGYEMLQRMNESHGPLTGWAITLLQLQENDCVLDIGCGGGAALARMSKQISSGHLTGVDYSPVSVAASRERNAADIQKNKMEIFEASVESLPFADGAFDKIITVESFYFWPDPLENLREVFRVLRSGGSFIIAADIYGREGLDEKTCENIRRYGMLNPTPEEFQSMLSAAGFSAVCVHTKDGEDWICAQGVK